MKVRLVWKESDQTTYNYGSQIHFSRQGVIFDNSLMPSGSVLKSWTSKRQFQRDRLQPDLPLLLWGKTYYLNLLSQTSPQNSLYIRISFFDAFDNLVTREILKGVPWSFIYPEGAFSYQIDIINAGCRRLVFKGLDLGEHPFQEQDQMLTGHLLFPKEDKPLTLLFIEKKDLALTNLPQETLANWGNLLLVADEDEVSVAYLSPAMRQLLASYVQAWQERWSTGVRLVAYGRSGHLAALYYSKQWSCPIYLRGYLAPLEVYEELIREHLEDGRDLWLQIEDRLQKIDLTDRKSYQLMKGRADLNLCAPLWETTENLNDLFLD